MEDTLEATVLLRLRQALEKVEQLAKEDIAVYGNVFCRH